MGPCLPRGVGTEVRLCGILRRGRVSMSAFTQVPFLQSHGAQMGPALRQHQQTVQQSSGMQIPGNNCIFYRDTATPSLQSHGAQMRPRWLRGRPTLSRSGTQGLPLPILRMNVTSLRPASICASMKSHGIQMGISCARVSGEALAVWDAATGEPSYVSMQPEEPVADTDTQCVSLAWSPDGAFAVTVMWDGTAAVWDAASGQRMHELQGHGGDVCSVAWSPDGRTVAAGSHGGTCTLWDAGTGSRTHEVSTVTGEALNWVAWSPGGRELITASWSTNCVRIYRVDGIDRRSASTVNLE